MPVRVLIPTPLRPYTGQRAAVDVEGGEVETILANLTKTHDQLRTHLFKEDGRLRSFVNVYVNDEDIRHLGGVRTPVADGDTISIVPSVAGGAGGVAEAVELPQLTHQEVGRYSRHLIVPEVGLEGQRKIKAARVLLVGAGGLGSPAALYLAAAGVGTLGLVDFDTVDVSNLQRQVLFDTTQIGERKTVAASARLRALNPGVNLKTHDVPLTSANALDIIRDYDIVVDGADNFATRYLVNDACVLLGKPNVYGSIFRFDGQASVFAVPGGPCYRCLYPEPPPPGLVPSCAEGGVLGVLPGLIGTVQATEALKLIIGAGESLAGRLLLIDALAMTFRTLTARRDPDCVICGDHPTQTTLIDYHQFCGVPGVPEDVSALDSDFRIDVESFKAELDRGRDVWILDVREPAEAAICRIPGATLIPLRELPLRLDEVPRDADVVVHCKMGARSATAVEILRDRGYTRVRNLEGGILAWIDRVDPSQPKY
jgi:adenylyltransferase/sulfurtransferase